MFDRMLADLTAMLNPLFDPFPEMEADEDA
jgi:hypothetical protein